MRQIRSFFMGSSKAQGTSDTLLDVSFAEYDCSRREYSKAMARSDFGAGVNACMGFNEGRVFVENGAVWGVYPKHKVGAKASGFTIKAPLHPVDEATLGYEIFFPKGFEWTKGGKLPGLSGGTSPTGLTEDTNKTENGWSARVMWRSHNRLTSYCYWPNREKHCGSDLWWKDGGSNLNISEGEWHTIRFHVKLNDVGKQNGENTVWVDGKQVLSETGIVWRVHDNNTSIDQMYMQTFYGGGAASPSKLAEYLNNKSLTTCFEPRGDNVIGFRNFKVWSGKKEGGC